MMLASSLDTPAHQPRPSTSSSKMSSTSSSSSSSEPSGSRPRRSQVEVYAQALRTRLQLASYKALNGVGKASFTDLSQPQPQPLTPSLVENHPPASTSTEPAPQSSPQLSTPALSQSESIPSSSQSSARSTRSIYMDIFGRDFSATPSSSKSLSRATSFASASTPSKRPASSWSTSASTSNSTSTRSLLDKAASSPQLGSPERKNGRFDWHNNPTPAMVAHESKLAAEETFAMPSGSPSKRRREASHNPSSSANPLLGTPKRSRLQSSGGFLPNGHPASSLAQDLGLTTPRTPRSRHASARHVFAIQPSQQSAAEQDQVERDRVASTLAALAEARNAGGSSSSDSSSGSDRPHTPPPPDAGLGIGFASPSVRRSSLAHSGAVKRGHKRNVSWSLLPTDVQEEQQTQQPKKKNTEEGEGEDRTTADYLLFLASSPSPSSIKRFSADMEPVTSNGILSTPAQTSLWDPFNSSDPLPNSGGRRSRLQSNAGPRHTNSSTPLTPPPSTRKPSTKLVTSTSEVFGLGFDSATLSSSTPTTPRKATNAEEYILLNQRTPRLNRTPPPPSSKFDLPMPTTPPNAPGAPGGDTTFHYADFVNVSPSPQPPSTGRFPGNSAYLAWGGHQRTPTKTNRFRFDPRHT